MRRLFGNLFFFILPVTLAAQVGDSVSLDLQEVEVSASMRPSVSQSSTPLQVLTASEIQKQGLLSVTDAVKRFNGVVLKDFGGIGGLKTISIRGMGAEYTAISYDEMLVSNSQSGQVDIGRFTLDNISMLSLSIGQDDNIFRAARAFASAGTLNLQTQRPEFTGKNYNLHTRVTAGSFGHFEPMINYARKLSEKSSLSANINWQRADGKYPFRHDINPMLENRKRRNSDTDILRSEANLYNKLSAKDNLDVKLYFFNSERGLPGSVVNDDEKKDKNERLWDKNAFAQLTYNRRFSDKWKLISIAKYDYNYQKYKTEQYVQGGMEKEDKFHRYRQQEIYWSNVLHHQILPMLSASLSQDLVYSNLRSEFPSSFNTSRSEPDRYSSYTALAVRYKTRRLTITASGLYTHIHEEISNKEDVSSNYAKMSPAVSASLKPFGEADLRLRTSYKHIYRIPTFSELYYQPIDRLLNPESSSQYNIGATWVGYIANSPFRYVNISADGYYNDIKDKIVVIPTPFLPTVLNQGKVEMKGLDARLSTNISLCKDMSVDVSGVYSYLRARDSDKKSVTYNGQLAYTPKHSGSATLTLNTPWANLSYSMLASSLRYTSTENLKDGIVRGYTDHSINLFGELETGKYKLYGNVGLLNLLNKNYSIIANYPMPGRAFRVTAGCKF